MRKLIITFFITIVISVIPCSGIYSREAYCPFAIDIAKVDSIVISGIELDSTYDLLTPEQNKLIIEQKKFYPICTIFDKLEFSPLIKMINRAKLEETVLERVKTFVPKSVPHYDNNNQIVFSMSICMYNGSSIELPAIYSEEFICGDYIYHADFALAQILKWYALQAYLEQNPQEKIFNHKSYTFGTTPDE